MKATGKPIQAPTSPWPSWAWWGREPPGLPLRHAVRLLRQASDLEELACGDGEGRPPLDRALQAYQRSHKALGRTDRLVLGTALYSFARNREVLRAALPAAVPGDGGLLLLGLLDALAADPGDVPHLPEGVAPWLAARDRVAALRVGWLRTLEAAPQTPLGDASPALRAAVEGLFSVPSWWLDRGPWETVGAAVGELARLRRPQQLQLRAQAHRLTQREALEELRREKISVKATLRSPWGIRIDGRHNVLALEVVRRGDLEVQDEGSQLVACACDPKPGERVLDLCAGGGGKTLALAAALQGRGQVVAHDADPRRLEDAKRRARRAGLGNVRVVADRGELDRLGAFDQVLVDAPCSSTGTLRRNPDVAWRWSPAALDRLVALQATILDDAAGRVAPGGTLVYATCSLLEPENGAQTRAFLTRHGDFAPAPLGDRTAHAAFADLPSDADGGLRLRADLPRYGGDGFYLARLRRVR